MDTRTLVIPEIELGEQLTKALRADSVTDLRAAMWWYDESSEELRFLAATPLYASRGPTKTFLHLNEVLSKAGLEDFPVSRLWPVDPSHEIVAKLRRIVAPEATRTTFQNCNVHGLFVPFVFIYFIAKARAGTRKKANS